jgi:hypothetical protein
MKSKPPEAHPALQEFVDEYTRLASLETLTDENAERMSAILELAQFDPELNDWISCIDKRIGMSLDAVEN